MGQGGVPTLGLGSKGLLYVQLDLEEMASDAHSGNATILPSAAWRMVQALAVLANRHDTDWANRAHAPNENIRLEDLGTAILLSRHVFVGLGH